MIRWLARVEDPRSICVFRILLGLLLLANVLALWPHADYLYAPHGVLPADPHCGQGLRRISAMCWVRDSTGPDLVFAAFALSCALFTLGAWTRITKWATAYLFLSITLRNPLPLAGEQVLGNFLFLLCLSRCGAAYSLDRWWRSRRQSSSQGPVAVPAWPRHLMILQLCLAYGVAGWAKTGATYVEGTSLYYVLANDRWFRFEPWWLLSTFGTNLLRVATWVAWWFERLFPLVAVGLVWGNRWAPLRWVGSRWIWASLCIAFAGTLIVFVNIGWFVPAMLAATVVLFRGEEVAAVIARIARRSAFPTQAPSQHRAPRLLRLTAVFVGWHALSMVTNAFSLGALDLPIPSTLRTTTRTWGRATNTFQFWGMFAPNAPGIRHWLIVDLHAESGETVPAFDDRELLGERRHPYVFIDRRQKIHSKLMRPDNARLHARWLCRTWRDENGHSPIGVSIARWRWPLADPRWMAAHGPHDPRPAGERYRRTQTIAEHPCEEPPVRR